MGVFNERVSDILESPVICEIWHCSYRQFAVLCLAIFFLTTNLLPANAEDKITRLTFMESIYERVFNKNLTEIEAINSGLLEKFDDKQHHLDWPVSRGMAAEAFYKLSLQTGAGNKLPRAFADIKPGNKFSKPLSVVGGAFLPQRSGKFNPNHLLERKDMFHAIRILVEKNVIKQMDRSEVRFDLTEDPKNDGIDELLRPDREIEFNPKSEYIGVDNEAIDFSAETTQRIARVENRLSAGQINPQIMSNIEEATEAMEKVEKLMHSLGGSVMELSAAYPKNKDDERDLRHALAKIEAILNGIMDRFEYSQLQLKAVTPVDPDQIRKCGILKIRIDKNLDEAKSLRNRITKRLSEKGHGD